MEAEDSAEESRHSFELRPSRGGASIRNDWTIAPEGVFCQRPDIYRKKLPEIPDHFSVKIETIDKVLSRKELFDRHNAHLILVFCTGKSLSEVLFLHQLIHSMRTDCSLNYKFNT